ncbi:MAG: hypothetical protein JXA44_13205 [Methanospirillaceae archaeon]|nr:hypothetical protein [Methanospirillaceae archaeon]
MTTESVSIENLKMEIDILKKEIMDIKSKLIDPDSILTEEDYISLQKYRKEKENGLLLSESEVRKGLDL